MPVITTDDGCRIHFTVRGSGPPLLILPGLGETTDSWNSGIALLEKDFTCITVDQRGAGLSGRPTRLWTARRMAKDAAEILDSLNIEKAHVAGFSLGGIVAQEFAFHHPGRLDRMVLVSTSPGMLSVPPPAGFIREQLPQELGTWKMARDAVVAYLRDQLRRKPTPGRQAITPPGPAGTSSPAAPDRARGILAAFTHVGMLELRRLRAPVLIIHGTADEIISPRNAELMHRLIRGSRLEIIQGGDHGLHYGHTQKVTQLIREFAQGVS